MAGGACSETFSGENLSECLASSVSLLNGTMRQMEHGFSADALSMHTSAGIVPSMNEFIGALEHVLPWKGGFEDSSDWMVSFQVEGGSAVWAAVDVLTQMQHDSTEDLHASSRKKVGVGAKSYHGPPSSSLGAGAPLGDYVQPGGSEIKPIQVKYPVPCPMTNPALPHETVSEYHNRLRSEFTMFLDTHGNDLAVIVVEPQWGSSVAAMPWPRDLLQCAMNLVAHSF